MDPLSVTIIVLTLIAACNALASTITKLNRLRHAPKEIEGLETEICALQTCIQDINAIIGKHSDNRSRALGMLSLGEHIKDAQHKIEQIQQFLDTSHLWVISIRVNVNVWCFTGCAASGTNLFALCEHLLSKLLESTLNCTAFITSVLTLSWYSAVSRGHSAQLHALASEGRAMYELQLQTFQALRRELRASRIAFDAEADKQYEGNENNSQTTTSKNYLTPLTLFNGRRRSDDSPLESSGIAIAANVDRPRRRSEGSLSVIEDPEEILDEEAILCLGAMSVSSKTNTHKDTDTSIKGSQLLIGYAGISSIALPCNEHACAQRQRMAVRFQYNFPVWSLIQRVLTFVSYWNDTFGTIHELRISRIRPGSDEVFTQVQRGNIRRLQQLFIQGSASPLDASDTGWTLLHYALSAGQLPTVKFLKDCGADVCAESTSRETPIEVAWNQILSGCLDERSELFLRDVFDNDPELDERQFTALHKIPIHLAAQTGNIATSRALVHAGAEINTVVYRTQITPTHYAAEYQNCFELIQGLTELGAWIDGHLFSLQALLQCGADVNSQTLDGNTAILLAVANNSHERVQMLIQAGADCSVVRHNTVHSLKSADISTVDLQHLRTRDTGQSVADMLDARLKSTTADDSTEAHDAWKRAWDNLTTSSCCKIEEIDNGTTEVFMLHTVTYLGA
ncbi:MAG: hypothetical protein Q9204_005655 [Flavoplaca sp. TL-2023a]